jgi:hypothetical protein
MWYTQFQDRLQDWSKLRTSCESAPLEDCLMQINNWWFNSPWQPYYLHWDDQKTWPDPWELLADNTFCSLARCLGIVYTIQMLNRTDITQVDIAESNSDNLVLVDHGKYILNWTQGELLNISSTNITIKKLLDSNKIVHLLG